MGSFSQLAAKVKLLFFISIYMFGCRESSMRKYIRILDFLNFLITLSLEYFNLRLKLSSNIFRFLFLLFYKLWILLHSKFDSEKSLNWSCCFKFGYRENVGKITRSCMFLDFRAIELIKLRRWIYMCEFINFYISCSPRGWYIITCSFHSLFFKQEMELSLIGLQNAGKTSLVNVVAVSKWFYKKCQFWVWFSFLFLFDADFSIRVFCDLNYFKTGGYSEDMIPTVHYLSQWIFFVFMEEDSF